MLIFYSIIKPTYLDTTIFKGLFEIVSEERKKKINSYQLIDDKIRSLLAEALLRYALWNETSININDLKFSYNKYGKPSLEDITDLHFNISHSGNWIVCGICDENIGVDVERHDDISFDIAKRYFANEEKEFILSESKSEMLDKFYKIWTLKESYIKAIGKGLCIKLNSFRFAFSGKIMLYIDEEINTEYSFKSYKIDSCHTASICWYGDEEEYDYAKFKNIDLYELCNLYKKLD